MIISLITDIWYIFQGLHTVEVFFGNKLLSKYIVEMKKIITTALRWYLLLKNHLLDVCLDHICDNNTTLWI